MEKLAPLLLALMLFAPIVAQAQDQDGLLSTPPDELSRRECLAELGFECVQLFTSCRPIRADVLVEPNTFGLTDRVRTAVESRLRAARLIKPGFIRRSSLQVSVRLLEIENTTLSVFTIEVALMKYMQDFELDFRNTVSSMSVPTWQRGSLVYTNYDPGGRILQSISEFMDEFINEYLRVNKPACD